jgi:hypothetical protein
MSALAISRHTATISTPCRMISVAILTVTGTLVCLPSPIRADIIDFETTPVGGSPSDNQVLDGTYNIAGGGTVRFFFDINANDFYDSLVDQLPYFEQIELDGVDGFLSNPTNVGAAGVRDRARPGLEGQLATFFLRHQAGNTGNVPGPFLIAYDTVQAITQFSGEIWDIDGEAVLGTEQWRVEALDVSGTVLGSLLSPAGLDSSPTSLDSLPWNFAFTNLPAGVQSIRLTFVGTKSQGIGLAFNNFSPTFAVPEPSSTVAGLVAVWLGICLHRSQKQWRGRKSCSAVSRRNRNIFRVCLLGLLLTLPCATSVPAQVWDGGAGTFAWHDAANWNTNSLPQNFGSATLNATLTSAAAVNLTADVAFNAGVDGINALTVIDGFNLDSNGFFLHVDDGGTGRTTVAGLGSTLLVSPLTADPNAAAFDTDELVIHSDGLFSLQGAHARVDNFTEVFTNGEITGHGELRFGDATSSGTIFTNRGTISVMAPLIALTGTLTLSVANNAPAGSLLDLSGSTGAGTLIVNDNAGLGILRLVVDGETADFQGSLDIGRADTAEFVHDLTVLGGTIDFHGDDGTATLTGSGTVATIGGIVNVNSGTGRIENPFTMGIASTINVANNKSLVLANTFTAGSSGTIDVGDNAVIQFEGIGNTIETDVVSFILNDNSKLNVHGDLTIDAGTSMFDWDGTANNSDTTVDGPGAHLTLIDSGLLLNQGDLRILNSGQVSIDGNSFWLQSGLLYMTDGGLLETLNGEFAYFTGTIRGESGTYVINGEQNIFVEDPISGSQPNVDVNGTLQIHNSFIAAGTWGDSSGHLQNAQSMTIAGPITMNFQSVDLDGPLGSARLALYGPLTLTVDTISEDSSNVFGQQNGVTTANQIDIFTNVMNEGSLNVQLSNPSGHWTIGRDAIVNLFPDPAGTEQIMGSDLRLEGQANIVGGASRWSARTTVGANPAEIAIDAISILQLTGGTSSNPNRIEGGGITGLGELQLGPSTGLVGYGQIDANVNFSGVDRFLLAADMNELIVNGTIIDVGRIGTANTGGKLRFGQPFNVAIADALELSGGIVTGMALSNNGGLTRGFGMITTQQFAQNAGGTVSADGGLLTIDVTAPQLAVTQGTLNAIHGNLAIADPLNGPFTGIVNVGPGRTVDFQGDWTLSAATGIVNLSGGTTLANQAAVQGATIVNNGANVNVTREAVFRDFVRFGQFATVNIPTAADTLRLEGEGEIPFAGANTAVLQGMGTLATEPSATLFIGSAVNSIRTNVRNGGTILMDPLTTGTVGFGRDFAQLGSGGLEMQLAGTAVGSFDRLAIAGTAQLAGSLDVSLLGGFVPALGNSFPILTAVGGVTGQFDMETLPLLPGLIGFDVVYLPTMVRLNVVPFPDFNADGRLDCLDVDRLVSIIAAGTNDPGFDLTGDGSVGQADLTRWLSDAGAVNLASGNSYLPGDANLDGHVDGTDFNTWNAHKFTATAAWCSGDFTADGVVDGSDFNIWNSHKFTSAVATSAVPEPAAAMLVLVGCACLFINRTRSVGR